MASEAVSKKGVMLGPLLDRIFMIFQTLERGVQMAVKIVFKMGSRREQVSNGRWTLSGSILGPFWPPKTTPFLSLACFSFREAVFLRVHDSGPAL